MDNIILWAGVILYLASLFLLNRSTSRFPDDLILEYQKKIKPGFIRYYLIGMIPLIVLLICLFAEDYRIIKFMWPVVAVSLLWDFITLLKVRTSIIATEHSKEYDEVRLYVSLLLLGKTLSLFGFFQYLSDVLN